MYAVSLIITSHCPYQQQRMLSCMQYHLLKPHAVLINNKECYHVCSVTHYNLTLSLSTTKNVIMYAVSLIITSHCPYQQQRMLSCMQYHLLKPHAVLINNKECYHVCSVTHYNLTLSLSTTKNVIMYAVSLIITSHCPYQQQRMLSCMQYHLLKPHAVLINNKECYHVCSITY